MARTLAALSLLLATAACSVQRVTPSDAMAATKDEHASHDLGTVQSGGGFVGTQTAGIPAGAADVAARLAASPRHSEWAFVPLVKGGKDSIAAYVVYPEAKRNAPVVVVIHEIFGLTAWVKGVADQLASDGFIAIAPDLLSIERGGASTDSLSTDQGRALIRNVTPAKMNEMVAAVARYGMALPAASKKYGVVGYCWGGAASFNHAVFGAPGLSAAVVYYGTSPDVADIAKVRIPVLGLYGETDQRVNATIARADSTMKATGAQFSQLTFAGAGHGFLRAQQDTANLAAAKFAWPETVRFFRRHLR